MIEFLAMKVERGRATEVTLTVLSAVLVIYGIWADIYSHLGSAEENAFHRDQLPDLYQEHIGNFFFSFLLAFIGILHCVVEDIEHKKSGYSGFDEKYRRYMYPFYLFLAAGMNVAGEAYYHVFKESTATEFVGDTTVGLMAIALTTILFRKVAFPKSEVRLEKYLINKDAKEPPAKER
jgi:hypothetical protein